MQLTTEQLPNHLRSSSLLPIYLIEGDENLLVLEAAEAVREAAKQAHFIEREVVYIDSNRDWDELTRRACSVSLFSEKKVIDLRTPATLLKKEAAKAILDYLTQKNEETLLLITTGRLDAATLRTKWAKEVIQKGAMVKAWPVGAAKLPSWIDQRFRSKNIRCDRDAIRVLADRVEGNLLAAAQEIDKIEVLVQSGQTISAEAMNDLIADNTHFDVYGLIDAALIGHLPRVSRMLRRLETEGIEPLWVVASVAREVRSLVKLAEAVKSGVSPDRAMAAAYVWRSRLSIVRGALERERLNLWPQLLVECSRIDNIVKGVQPGHVWSELLQLLILMAGQAPLSVK
jgi:DNA polymerase-3 subunit delta